MHTHIDVPLSVVSVVLCSSEEGSSPLGGSLKRDNSGLFLLKIERWLILKIVSTPLYM